MTPPLKAAAAFEDGEEAGHCHSLAPARRGDARARGFHRVALVGNPNVGKSVIFGWLTGTYATVSNYPGTTVEIARARAHFDPSLEIIDTPGVNGLTPNSEDERVTRDILLAGVDCVIQVGDAKNLARTLSLSLQLSEAGVPFVLVLNMIDEAADRGITIDAKRLSARLGVPVITTVAIMGRGLGALPQAVAAARAGSAEVHYPAAVDRALLKIERLLAGAPIAQRALALMCLAGDDTLRAELAARLAPHELETVEDCYREVQRRLGGRVRYELTRCRVQSAERLAREVSTLAQESPEEAPHGVARWTATGCAALLGCVALLAGDLSGSALLTHPALRIAAWAAVLGAGVATYRHAAMRRCVGAWASRRGSGTAMLAVVLYVVYRFVGSFAAGTAVDFLEETLFGGFLNPLASRIADAAVAASAGLPGAGAVVFVRDLMVGPYGLVTVGLTYAFAIVFPIVTAFFLAFSLLEDSGYLPRLAIIVNRVLRGMGLNGKAVLPMVLGLGCDTMATLTARIMETPKERLLITLLLALGVPCSAQLGVILGLFGALPAWAPLAWGGVVLGVLFAVGFLAARVLPGERSDLILEIPPIRRPQLGNILIKTVGRLEWYLKEAVPIFVLGTFILFLLDRAGALAVIVRASEPAVTGLLGLPARAAEAFLVGFFRRDYGSAGIYALFEQGLLSPVQAVVALITITLFVPCVANFFVIVKERGPATAAAITLFIFPFAFAVGGAVNAVLRACGFQ